MYGLPGVDDAAGQRAHLGLAEHAFGRGINTIFAFEHHFTSYILSPNPVQILTYLAGRLSGATLGTSAIVVPTYNLVRLAEEIAFLDNINYGNCIFGFARGRKAEEYQGLGYEIETDARLFQDRLHALAGLLGRTSNTGGPEIRPRARFDPVARFYVATRQKVPSPLGGHFPILSDLGSKCTRRAPTSIVFAPITIALDRSTALNAALDASRNDLLMVRRHYMGDEVPPSGAQLREALRNQIWGAPEDVVSRIKRVQDEHEPLLLVLEFAFGSRGFADVRTMIDIFSDLVAPELNLER
jgi:alkanesulfonate monooxygenase SsuD/methylene tetrahydromethanopterin reductase-like flavin-dependent oxidoreductase (luciferase family)